MIVDREQLMRDGYIIIREVIAPNELESLRASYETLIERQGGRKWLESGSPMPRISIHRLLDESTADTAEIWLRENTLGVARQLLCVGEAAAVNWMWCMCSTLTDHGPDIWHRDVHPIDMGPMRLLQLDVLENGPRYVQWNIALYDDDVLWAVPGSHRRLNTPQENNELLADNRVPLSTGIPIELKAGDGVVYNNHMLHWGSNYSAKLRRTLHGGHCIFTGTEMMQCTEYLSAAAQALFAQWTEQAARMQDLTETALRAVLAGDGGAFDEVLETLQPGVGPAGKLVLAIYLCKAAQLMRITKHPDLEGVPDVLKVHTGSVHQSTLFWGPAFAQRFSDAESEALWHRFGPLEARLQTPQENFMPGYQSGPMSYQFEDMAEPFDVEQLVASWS